MSKLFTTVKANHPRKSAFDLSHERKTTCKMGQLVPILSDEIMPGDKFNIKSEVMVRLAPMLAPVMARANVYIHYFFVPNRLIWSDWEDFITNQGNVPLAPTQNLASVTEGSLFDHLGVPPGDYSTGETLTINPLVARAYYQIWNDYYRDQNLETEMDVEAGIPGTRALKLRAWEKDYFTSALPNTQQGSPVGIPVNANYIETGSIATHTDGSFADGPLSSTSGAIHDNNEDVIIKNLVDGSEMNIDINEFRMANSLQKWLERQMRSGSRYIESLLAHWGVISDDARLQRAEFLGGGKTPIQISEVLSTFENDTVAQGQMTGHGLAVGQTSRANKRFKEHGWLMGIMSIMPRTNYVNGVHRSLLRRDAFEYPFPEFAHFGEHAVLNKELFVDNTTAETLNGTFGYQSQYSELKYKNSSVHGAFRSSLNFWHMGRIFSQLPVLNDEFIQCKSDAINERIFAAGNTEDQLFVQIYHNIKAVRPLPYYGTPSL